MMGYIKSNLVDFHCHLDLYPEYESLLSECDHRGVHTLTVTTTPKAWPRNFSLASRTTHVRAALGLHPQLVAERGHELSLWNEYLSQTRYVGEVGLDASPRFYKHFDKQIEIFEHILRQCSNSGNKIITVHSVRAVPKVLDIIEKVQPLRNDCKVILHWFTGSQIQAKRAIELGCYFSINKAMIPRNSKVIDAIPLNRLLTETDGPFTGHKGEPARPYNVVEVLSGLAELKHLNESALLNRVYDNLTELES